jgi:hypothetical protein
LGAVVGAELARRPVFNAGVIAARGSSPLWPAWVEAFQASLLTGRYVIVDQVTLNQILHGGGLRHRIMTPHYNWICNLAPPLWDAGTRRFVEPLPPYAPIGIVHLTGHGRTTTTVMGLDGRTSERGYQWSEPAP